MTVSWAAFEGAAPELAAAVRERFGAHRHCVLATLRRDGSPRVSGFEFHLANGDLWLPGMPGARKAGDLRRDGRFALHCAPLDLELHAPDAKVAGIAVEVTDPGEVAAFAATLPQDEGGAYGDMALFRAALTEAVLTRVEGDEIVIESWHPGSAPRTQRRR